MSSEVIADVVHVAADLHHEGGAPLHMAAEVVAALTEEQMK